MTRKDYIIIARALGRGLRIIDQLARLTPEGRIDTGSTHRYNDMARGIYEARDQIVTALTVDNPRFDVIVFRRAIEAERRNP